jgi:glycosyltransferase involved in cell wall biosynthesis
MKCNNKNRVINIMYIIDYLYGGQGGGTERHLSYLVSNINRDRFRPVIVAYDTGDTPLVENIKKSGTDVIHVPVGRYYTVNALKQSLAIKRLIRSLGIDIVQTYHFKSDTLGVMSAKLAGVKRIVSSKRDIGDCKKKIHYYINQNINKFVDEFIVVADKVGEVLARKERIPPTKLTTIYNGVDTLKFKPATAELKMMARERIGLCDSDFVIGMVAVFRPEKNHNVLLDAMKILADRIENIKAVIVGDGPLLKFYRNYCRENAIEDKVIFTGATTNVSKFLEAMDVACLVPGSNEGFSNAILEKMAMGLPLVVTDIGGNAEAVIDGFNGKVVPPNRCHAVADAIMEMYKDKDLRIKMGNNSRIRAEQCFDLSKMISNYENYYQSLIGMSCSGM